MYTSNVCITKGVFMIRSQIYLTATERKELHVLAQDTGKSQSELIRLAIDQFIVQQHQHKGSRLAAIQAVKGLWKDRKDLPNFSSLRQELDRF